MRKYILAVSLLSLVMIGCTEAPPEPTAKASHLNVTVLLDLSSRINAESDKNRSLQPDPSTRDREIIKEILSVFKDGIRTKGALSSKDKIKVVFSPAPSDAEINSMAKTLSVDFDALPPKDRKKTYQTLLSNFDETLKQIYVESHFRKENCKRIFRAPTSGGSSDRM